MERQTDGTIKIVGDKNLVTRNDRNYHDLDMMPSYFRNVVKDGVGATWQPNTAYIYTEVTNMPRIRKLGILPVNSTGYNYLGSAQSFKPINNRESRTVKSAWVIKFTYRGRTSPYIRGFYFPDDRVLYIGRLYANSCGYDYAEGIINTLKERFGIAELPPLPPVTSATPAQKECGPTCTVCVGSCKNYVNRKRVTVGTDPEFEITRNGAVISPDRNKYHGLNSEIGLDGAGSQLEVRPKAFVKATDTTNYIKKIMEKIGDSISTIGNRFPVGGHIHLGVGTSYTPSTDLLWLLDAFVGKPTIDLSGTARQYYRTMSAYECKPWGFEYRTPPAAPFTWPEFARLAMKASKNITEAYINGQTIIVSGETPNCDDYRKYCRFSTKEYNSWVKFIADYPTWVREQGYQKDIIAYWTKKRPAPTATATAVSTEAEPWTPPPPPPVPDTTTRVFFSDDWSNDMRAIFRATVERIPDLGVVNLYGLRADRGNVICGFSCEGFDTIPSVSGRFGDNYFGFPYNVRMASTPLPSDSPVNTILSAVANRLRSGSSPATETDSTPEAIPDVEENNATTDATIDANEISDATTVNPTATDETTIDDVNTL